MPRRAVALLLVIAVAPWTVAAQQQTVPRDRKAEAALVLAVDRLMADRWYPGIPRAKGDPPASEDEALLQNFLSSTFPYIRRLAVRSVGRFLNPLDAPFFESLQGDRDVDVRREARFWWARVLGYTRDPAQQRKVRQQLIDLLYERLPTTPVDAVFDAIARLGGIDEPTAIELERFFVEEIDKNWPYAEQDPQLPKARAALEHLQPLLALFPNRTLQPRTRTVLARVGQYGFLNSISPPSLTALEALTFAGVADRQLAQAMLRYMCGKVTDTASCGWEYRRQGVLLLDVRDESSALAIEDGLRDPSTIVRLELYRRLAATVEERKTCAPFMKAFEDPSPVIRLEALDWLLPVCKERDDIVIRLKLQAADLGEEPEFKLAPFAGRALLALARFSPEDVKAITEKMVASGAGWNGVWQYRAAAARAATIMQDEAFAIRFVDDAETNVQYEALHALLSMNSDARWTHAIKALESDDYRVVYTGAAMLRRMPDPEGTMHPLVAALTRLTKEDKDTSRSARLEIINRLKEIAPPNAQGVIFLNYHGATLEPYLKDSDPAVASGIADVFGLMYGKRPVPSPVRRPIEQPSLTELTSLPSGISVPLGPGDDFGIALNVEEAPLTVARFVKLARSGYYNGQFFYRLLPLNLFQTGSPRSNDFMGYGRFIRDELGRMPHRHGTVGWASQGPDTGDSQFFVNLLDAPRRQYEYTVLGVVVGGHKGGIAVPGMEVVLDLIEGTRIVNIQPLPPPKR